MGYFVTPREYLSIGARRTLAQFAERYNRTCRFIRDVKPGDPIPDLSRYRCKDADTHPKNLKFNRKVGKLLLFTNKKNQVETFNFAQLMERLEG